MSNEQIQAGQSNSDNWLIALAIVAGMTLLVSPVACTMHRQIVIERAINAGADPIAAKCAIEADTGTTPVCVAYAARGGK